MRKIFLCFALLSIFLVNTGCVAPPTKEQLAVADYGLALTQEDAEQIVKEDMEDVLIDPYTAQYKFEPLEKTWSTDYSLGKGKVWTGYEITVYINSRNRLGGYTGRKKYRFLMRDGRILQAYQYNEYGTPIPIYSRK